MTDDQAFIVTDTLTENKPVQELTRESLNGLTNAKINISPKKGKRLLKGGE